MNVAGFLGGLAAGGAGGIALVLGWLGRRRRRAGTDVRTVDFQQALDLLRRAHGAAAACLVLEADQSECSLGEPRPGQTLVDRTVATARLAREDGRLHTIEGDPWIVALGDGEIGAALALGSSTDGAPTGQVVEDLRRFIAGFRVRLADGQVAHGNPRRAFDITLARLDSVESLSLAVCEAARTVTDHPTAVVVRDPITQIATVVAVSRASDRRLLGTRVTPDSRVGQVSMGEIPMVGASLEELFGAAPGDRRVRDEAGVVYPLNTGREGVGALIVFGRSQGLPGDMHERLSALAWQVAPHLARAGAVRAAEARALTDGLTGLANRRALERVLVQKPDGPRSLLMVDVDHFKRLNDGFGHAAGDAALKHMAQIFNRLLRGGDVAARYGGEEFALVLARSVLTTALEVAERVRRAAAESKLTWAGAELTLTCSIGVASYPEPIRDPANLAVSADAALLRAKENGRNRVEVAGGSR